MDRFGLRVVVSGLTDVKERRDVARRVQAFAENRYEFSSRLAEASHEVAEEINAARQRLPRVSLTPAAERAGLDLASRLQIQSLRAEIVTLQAARARAAADGRETADVADVVAVAPMALRLRHSPFIADYIASRRQEDRVIQEAIDTLDLHEETEVDQ
jgi:magnesium chelatase subunit I